MDLWIRQFIRNNSQSSMVPSFSYFCSRRIVNPTCPQSSVLQLLQNGTPSSVSTITSLLMVLSYRMVYLLSTNCFKTIELFDAEPLSSEPNHFINASIPWSRVSKCDTNFEILLFPVFVLLLFLLLDNLYDLPLRLI